MTDYGEEDGTRHAYIENGDHVDWSRLKGRRVQPLKAVWEPEV